MKQKRFLSTGNSKIRKIFLFLVAVTMCFCMTGEAMGQTVASGTTGDCTWALTGTSGNYTLTISGNGAMGGYYSISSIPWSNYRDYIKTVDIQQGVTSIGNCAFPGCSTLTSVAIPNSVTDIGNEAFSGCTGLTTVIIPNSVTDIGDYAFHYCIRLTSVTIPNSVTDIGGATFSDCTGLTSVTIPNSVTDIGGSAFFGCTGLTSVTIPNSVTSIGLQAFYGCSGLTSVTIPNSVTSIGTNAFGNCIGLTTINSDASNLNYSSVNGVLFNKSQSELIQYPAGKTGNYTIPNSVTSIGNYAFSSCSGLTSVTIPNSVTSIGNYAFYGCSGLTSVTIPNSVTSIGNYAFSSCSGLTSVTIPNSVTSIGNYAFSSCSGLTSVTIPNSVTSIGNYAFYGCSGLTSVAIGNSVTSIGTNAFYGCSGLTAITVDANNRNYSSIDGVLSNKSQSELVLYPSGKTGNYTIPNSVKSIGNYAFSSCSGLTSVTIDNSVTSIGNGAFYNCSGLTSITIPDLITSIGNYAFRYCSALTTVNFNAIDCRTMGTYSDPVFADCTALTTLSIGNEVETIPSYAFSGCSSLTVLTIGNSVTSIKTDAFSGCTGLKKLVIAEGTRALPFNYSKSYSPYTNDIFADCPLDTVSVGRNITYNNTYDDSTSRDFSPFYNKTTIRHLIVGTQVTSVGKNAFEGCSIFDVIMPVSPPSGSLNSSLEKLTITSECTSLKSGCLAAATNLQELTLPFIGTSPTSPTTLRTLFNSSVPTTLKKLSTVYSPAEITIASEALSGLPQLNELTLSSNVIGIGNDALAGCYGIRNIYVHSAAAPAAYEGISESVYALCILHVPAGRAGHYGSRLGWKEFLNSGGIQEEAPLVITAYTVPRRGGEILQGTGQFNYDAENTLKAGGNWGYDFQCWIEDNIVVSTDSEYTFTVAAPRTLYAVFAPRENADENIQIQAQAQSASVSWAAVTDATNYTLVIYRDDSRTDTVAVFQLDANGQVQQSSEVRAAQQDLSCSIPNLTAETQYYYSLTSYDAEDYALTIAVGDFTTQTSGLDIESVENRQIRLYPNPVKESFRIEGLTAPTPVTVTDVSGRTVLQQAVAGDESISVRHLPQGIYLINVNGKTLKAIKN